MVKGLDAMGLLDLLTQCSICAGSPKPFNMRLAPWAASARAIPRPIPLVEPVTRAVFQQAWRTSELLSEVVSMCDPIRLAGPLQDAADRVVADSVSEPSGCSPHGSAQLGAATAPQTVVCVHGLTRVSQDFDHWRIDSAVGIGSCAGPWWGEANQTS